MTSKLLYIIAMLVILNQSTLLIQFDMSLWQAIIISVHTVIYGGLLVFSEDCKIDKSENNT